MASGKKYGHMGLALLIAAPVIIFNPDMAVVDILPDFIAYIMISVGITRMSYICPQIEAALPRFRWAAVVSGAKFILMFWVFGMSNQNERPMVILLSAFSMAVIELILTVPAWCGLFDGLLYLGSRTGAMVPYSSKRGRVTITGYAKAVTVVFLFVKPLCAVLPEFASLSMGGFDDTKFNWYEFIGLLREFGIFFGLIAGVFWLIVVERYFIRLKNDSEFVPALRRKYNEEVAEGDIRFTKRRICLAFAMLAAAFFFEMDIMLEYNNIIPDALAAVCFFAFFMILGSGIFPKWKTGAIISGIYAVVAGISDWLQYDFNSKYFNASVWQSDIVRKAFLVRYAFIIVASVLFMTVVLIAAKALKHIVYTHAGFIAENSDAAFREAKLAEIRRSLYRWIHAVVVIAAICAVSFCIGDAIITMNSSIYDSLGIISGAMRSLSEVWWIISALLCLVNFIVVLKTESEISAEIESRYMLD